MPELETKVNDGWFVPSRAEWSAFGDMLYTKFEVDKNNYSELGLSGHYWSSSQYGGDYAWFAIFGSAYMSGGYIASYGCVRLSTTF